MKSIELTEEHKSKLLEMCKVFFPKHCEFEFFVSDLRFLFNKDDSYLTFIHWFEFCMVHLASKVIKGIDINTREDDDMNDFDIEYRQICFGYLYPNMKIHPIDYLYEQFKLMK